MFLSTDNLNKLSLLAIKAAEQAGDYIRGFDRSLLKTHFKEAGSSKSSQVVTEVDLTCQDIILKILQPSCDEYDLALLSEENSSEHDVINHPRFSKDYFWCIDPLDGTLPFIEGEDGYAVSIALVDVCGKPVVAVVHQPTKNITDHTWLDQFGHRQCYKNRQPLTKHLTIKSKKFTFYSDRSFQSSEKYPLLINQLKIVVEELGYDHFAIQEDAGAVVNALSVIENSSACYIKLPKKQLGGGCLWDFSATACLAEASGVWVSDIDGKLLDLNLGDSNYMNHQGVLYASDTDLARRLSAICRLLK